MASENVSLWELALGFVGSVVSAVFTAWKLLNARFVAIEQELREHVEMDIGVHARHGESIERLNDVVCPQVQRNSEDIVRLQAEHEEKVRRLDELKVGLDRLHAKTDTVMETLANVLMRIGK